MIDAGKLDRRMTLMSASKARDAAGQQRETYTVLATVWAERLELKFTDVARTGADEVVATAKFRIRYRSVTVGQRVEVDGQAYRVIAVDPQDRRASLIVTVASA